MEIIAQSSAEFPREYIRHTKAGLAIIYPARVERNSYTFAILGASSSLWRMCTRLPHSI